MKRKALENTLRKSGWQFLRHGRKHDVWTDGEHQEYIPRHVEVNEMLARAIIKRTRKGC